MKHLFERYENLRQWCLKYGNLHPESTKVCHQALQHTHIDSTAIALAQLLDDMALALQAAPIQVETQGCAECGKTDTKDSMIALYCVDCIQQHNIGALPWIDLVAELCPDGIENCCDECGGDDKECPSGCCYRKARVMLAAVTSPSTPPMEPSK